ncbi:hypothetical protein A9R16_003445 [Acidiferrobacter thiooxydans]|uniref:hypothetical protein n=1 Tax=Acidiferrobacter thiooxydans TaxID=163359 RepID=UPI0008266123|nr:hypothetical protein [Acidiferrobacter thiooxydans]UEO00469.1 hypothetical protein A9R16_003445 [Acidiferrobacter thiooxydans]
MTWATEQKGDLHEAWNALANFSYELFAADGVVVAIIDALISAPDREPPREDMVAAAAVLCQTIQAAIDVAQGLAVHLCGPDPAKEGSQNDRAH